MVIETLAAASHLKSGARLRKASQDLGWAVWLSNVSSRRLPLAGARSLKKKNLGGIIRITTVFYISLKLGPSSRWGGCSSHHNTNNKQKDNQQQTLRTQRQQIISTLVHISHIPLLSWK
jgi:hypothetical protein